MDAAFRKRVGARLRAFRRKAGLSYAGLAHVVGVRESTVVGWESGRRGISLDSAYAICGAVKIAPSDLLDPSPSPRRAHRGR